MPTAAEIRKRNRAMKAMKSAPMPEDFQPGPDAPGAWDDALVAMEQRIAQKLQKAHIVRRLAGLGHMIETQADYNQWRQLCATMGCRPRQCGYNLSHAGYQFAGLDPNYV